MRGRQRRAAPPGALAVVLGLVAAGCASAPARLAFETRAALPAATATPGPTTTAALQQGGLLPAAGVGGRGAGPGSAGALGPSGPATGAGGAGAAAPGSRGVIKLGTVLPLEGGQRDWGEPVLRATQAFIDELNDRGGVRGFTLQLVAYNACLTCQDDALQATRRLVEQDGVFALVNTYPEAVAFQPVVPYLADRGVPLVQGGAENQTSDALSPVNFATAPPGLFYGRLLPKMVTDWARMRKIGLTYLNVPSEAGGIPLLKRELAKEGVQVVDEEPIQAAEDAVTNMDSVVTRMRLAGAEGALATNPVLVVYGRLAAQRQNWQAPWVGEAAWSGLAVKSCGTVCDEWVYTDTAGLSWVGRPTPQMQQYRDVMQRRYPGGDLSGHTLAAWVGMQLTVEMLARVGPDRAAFIDALNRVDGLDLGTTSPLRFTPDRHMGGTATVILKFRGGQYYAASDPVSYGEAPPR